MTSASQERYKTTVLPADCLLHYAASLTRDVLARVWQDPRYKDLEDENIPRAESLKLTVARFLPAWFVRVLVCVTGHRAKAK